ncbi:putative ankyrin repeat protein RF_0381 [Microplitis mediator]|uniref:putative ankyrin repeat protein RF_0381 n=1 Tax=Microplitis mediator TaxID=375433 RepID=UPI0025533767|nr:putative ankyrin repeat protein RF_0381 [Microplitis mediator]
MSDDETPPKRRRLDTLSSKSDDTLNDSDLSEAINQENLSDSDSESSSSDNIYDNDREVNSFQLIAQAVDEDANDNEEFQENSSFSDWIKGSSVESTYEDEEELVSLRKESKDTQLHVAVKAGDIELVKKIMRTGVDVNAPGEDSNTALHLAVDNELLPAIKCLVEYGANISAKNKSDDPYLRWETPLHIAVRRDRLDILELLFTTEINVQELMKNYDTNLRHAVERKNFKLINSLAGNSNYNNYNSSIKEVFKNFSMQQLSKMGYGEDLIALLFGKYADINVRNKSDQTLLFLAVTNKNVKMIKYLLDNGADINAVNCGDFIPGWTALHAAAEACYEDVVKILLDHQFCDVNVKTDDNITPLHIAASKNNLTIVKMLLEKNALFDIHGQHDLIYGLTPYHVAVYDDCLEVTEYFLDNLKIDVDKKTMNDESALQVAVRDDNCSMTKLLLDHGADINYFSKDQGAGFTALHIAAQNGNAELVDLLLSRGADVNIMGNDVKTILHMAVCSENEFIVKRLLACGADVNRKSNTYRFEGITPLLEASSRNLKEIILMLINAGADVNATATNKFDDKRQSIIDIAIKGYGDDELLKMLLNLGVDINNSYVHLELADASLTILEQHVLKLKAAGLFVHQRHLDWSNHRGGNRDFQKECRRELKKMKTEKINKSNICYYDLLAKDVDQLAMYAENKNIRKAVKLDKLTVKYPLYAEMLVFYFKKGQKRNQLLNDVEKFLEDVFIKLPHNCVRNILVYLSDDDLLMCLGRTSSVMADK